MSENPSSSQDVPVESVSRPPVGGEHSDPEAANLSLEAGDGAALAPEAERDLWVGRTHWKHYAGRLSLWLAGNVLVIVLLWWLANRVEWLGARGVFWLTVAILVISGLLVVGRVFLTILGHRYRLIPFKGIYRKLKKSAPYTVNGNIYPVPDIRNPFLGIHFTRGIHGDVYLGPTAIPAFGRENYGILRGIDGEGWSILWSDAILFGLNPKFRSVALTEPRKYIFSYFFEDAKKLVKKLEPEHVESCDKVGIRSQLVDWTNKEMVMDFLVESSGNAVHILNPVSPAFTCSMALAKHVVKNFL